MKRKFLAAATIAAASVAVAMPSTASASTADLRAGEGCYPGEPTDTCVIRIGRTLSGVVLDVAERTLYQAGDYAEKAIDSVEKICEERLSGCNIPTP
jgi:outer membrane protein assembly factor BamA